MWICKACAYKHKNMPSKDKFGMVCERCGARGCITPKRKTK